MCVANNNVVFLYQVENSGNLNFSDSEVLHDGGFSDRIVALAISERIPVQFGNRQILFYIFSNELCVNVIYKR